MKRNGGQRGCHCKQAQAKADDRKRRLQNYRGLTTGPRKFIRDKITSEQWSPAQIVGHLRKGGKCVCVETVYAHVRADKAAGGNLWKHCRHRLRHRKRRVKVPYTAVRDRTMTDERPGEWNGSTPGDFEMDTIAGKDGKGAILTLVGRNASFLMARKLPKGKNAPAPARTAVLMLPPCIGKIRSPTTDNGSGSAGHLLIAKRLKTRFFFAHPYSAWEKGCIECHNKLIRQYIPKGTDFNNVSEQMLKEIVIKINRRPRLKLGFSTPAAGFLKFIA